MKKNLLLLLLFVICFKLGFGHHGFIENKGQVVDQNGAPVPQVLYVLSVNGYNVSLLKDGFSYDFIQSDKQNETLKIHRVEIKFENIQNDFFITTPAAHTAPIHFYNENGAFENVRSYDKITFQNVYEGVDIEFVFHAEKGFEYNFICDSPESMNRIKLRYTSDHPVELANNQLVFNTRFGAILEHIPASFKNSDQTALDIRYKINNGLVTFHAPHKLPHESFTIDPSPILSYATYFGGTLSDVFVDLCTTADQKNIYVGRSASPTSLATTGAFQLEMAGIQDGLILAMDPNNNELWTTYFGGTESDNLFSCDVQDESLFIVGSTSSYGLATADAFQNINQIGGTSGLIAKFSLSGIRVWSSYFGSDTTTISDCKLLSSGHLVFIGVVSFTTLPILINPFDSSIEWSSEGFIAEFSPDGALTFCSYIGGNKADTPISLDVDNVGNIYVAGGTTSDQGIAFNTDFQPTYQGERDGFILKISPDYVPLEATYFGATSEDLIYNILCSENMVIVSGNSRLPFPLATVTTELGEGNKFLALFDNELNQQWCMLAGEYDSFGGVSSARAIDLSSGSIYFAFETAIPDLPTTLDAYRSFALYDGETESYSDIFFTVLDFNGAIQYATYFGDVGRDFCNVVRAVDNRIILAGSTVRSTADIEPFNTPDALQSQNNGESDGLIAIFDLTTSVFETTTNARLNAFPVPANTNLQLSSEFQFNRVQLVDMKGALVMDQMISPTLMYNLNIANVPNGLYQLIATGPTGVQNKKIAIQR